MFLLKHLRSFLRTFSNHNYKRENKDEKGALTVTLSDDLINQYLIIIVSYHDFVVDRGRFNFNNGSYFVDKSIKHMCIDLSTIKLSVGDLFYLPSFNIYDFKVGTNISNKYIWIDKWLKGKIVLTTENVKYAKGVLLKRLDDTEIKQSDLNYISNNFKIKSTKIKLKDNVIKEICFKNNRNTVFIHFSFDDVTYCLENLNNNKSRFTSIFDDPFLARLHDLHEKYSAKFSLYVYWNIFSQLDDTFKEDFSLNSDWLKIGFHAINGTSSFLNESYENANRIYGLFLCKCLEVAGTPDVIDMIPRFHYFGGSEEALNGMKNTNGFFGCLTADDNRNTIYLNEKDQEYLRNNDKLFDKKNNLMFYSTDMRLDWFDNFSSKYLYDKPVKDNPYDELVYRMNTFGKSNMYNSIIIFTHERQCYRSSHSLVKKFFDYIEQVCQFATDYKIAFDYPMYHVRELFDHSEI